MHFEYVDRLHEIMDHRLRPSSMRTVRGGREKWQDFSARMGWRPDLQMDAPEQGSKLAMWIMWLADNTKLTYHTISGYLWGVCVWLSLQQLPDPRNGVLNWGDFMASRS